MRYFIAIIFFLMGHVALSQSTLPLRADTVLIEKTGGNGELKIKNSTRDSLGILVNMGGGKTRFVRGRQINDSTFLIPPADTIIVRGIGGAANLVARGGLTKRNDTLFLGGSLDSFTLIKTISRKNVTPGVGVPNNAIVISNMPRDSSGIPFLISGNEDKALLYGYKFYDHNDTLSLSYGGAAAFLTRYRFDAIQPTRFKSPSTPFYWNYGGLNIQSQLYNADSMYIQASPFGGSGGNSSGIDIGAGNAYRINIFSQSNISSPYPITVWRAGLDLARVVTAVKRESLGTGYAGYTWDWRNEQTTITGGSTETGSYVGRVVGFNAYGLISPQSSSPSKEKTLAVSTADTVIGVQVQPMWGATNEVKNGYSLAAWGANDMAYLAGSLRVGGTLPLHGQQIRRFHNLGTAEITDTTYINKRLIVGKTSSSSNFQLEVDSTLRVGTDQGTGTYASIGSLQQNITPATLSTRRVNNLVINQDMRYDEPTNITGSFIQALNALMIHRADSFQNVSSQTNGSVFGGTVGLYLRKKTGYNDTTVFQSGTTPLTGPVGFRGLLDLSGAGTSTNLNFFNGWYIGLGAAVNMNSWNIADSVAYMMTGLGQSGFPNGRINTGYQLYMLPNDASTVTKYGLYQSGILDSNILKGPSRFLNLTNQEVALASHSITSITALGSTSGGLLNLYAKDLPTAANQRLGAINFGTRNGASAENFGVTLDAFTNAAWTDGSAEQAYARLLTNSSGTQNEVMRWTANARVGIGAVTNPGARVQIAAGFASSGGAPLMFTAGTNLTTPAAGAEEYDGTSRFFTPGSTRLRYVLTNNAIPSNGQLPIGNGTDFTLATITGSSSVSVSNGAGSITLSVPTTYITSADFSPSTFLTTNVTSATVNKARYQRTGNIITFSINITADPTAAGLVEVGISFPSGIDNIAAANDVSGTANTIDVAGENGEVIGDLTNNRFLLRFTAIGVGARTYSISGQYTYTAP